MKSPLIDPGEMHFTWVCPKCATTLSNVEVLVLRDKGVRCRYCRGEIVATRVYTNHLEGKTKWRK